MPSRFEPCGLGQMIALRYGSIPLVRRTGGLADTIIDIDDHPLDGNGFVFDKFSSDALLATVRRAVARFGKTNDWRRLVERAMRCDFSWKESASLYQDVYRRARQKAEERD
jgi:starch synthase